MCSKALRTVLGKSLIHSRVIIEDTSITQNQFSDFVSKLTMIDVFQTLLDFELFLAELVHFDIHKNICTLHCRRTFLYKADNYVHSIPLCLQ